MQQDRVSLVLPRLFAKPNNRQRVEMMKFTDADVANFSPVLRRAYWKALELYSLMPGADNSLSREGRTETPHFAFCFAIAEAIEWAEHNGKHN